VASNVSSLPEIVGDAGLLIDPNDSKALADALERALTDDTWRNTAREKGLARAAQFSWEESARIALSVYEQVLS
jgi:glycosyltransferase involved in cell wall biosynthesis